MNVATDAPARPALRYYGGKWNLAPWIISHFPPHKNYVEPCAGACSVLLQKPRSRLETINDLDGNVVNFFQVLRDRPEDLMRKIRLTPWAREEYEVCRSGTDDPLETARRFFCSSWMAISAMPFDKSTGMRTVSDSGQCYSLLNIGFTDASLAHIESVAARLAGVQIENVDYRQCIDRYDNLDSLIFFDPPYVKQTRTVQSMYVFEWSDEQHAEAARLLRQRSGYVVVSGYACPLYTELYESHGWHRVDKESQTNSGGKRIESLWLSPRTWQALHNDFSDSPLFSLSIPEE